MEAQENTHTIYQDMATSTTEESVRIYSEDVLESTRDLDDYCDEIKTFADQDEDLFEADTDDLTYELSRSPVTTESYIDTTAVLLPSGGSLSHHQALKTSVCETEPHQYSNYDFKNQMKDKDTNHSQLYDFPKKHSGNINISRSTIPFSLGTFVEQDKTHDSFIRETINSKTIQNTAKQSLEINTKQYILDANESSINIDNLLKDAGRLHHRDSGILWKIENNQCTGVKTFNINNQVGPQGWDDMYIDSEIIKEDPKILNTQDQEVEQIINSVLEEAIKVKYNENMPENPSDISTSEKEDKYLENHNEILDYHVMCKEVDSNEEIKSKTMEVQDKYADSLDLNVARNQQNDLIDIASITCQLSLEESIARITLPETMECGLRQRNIYYENEQGVINVSEEETICLFKEAEQQEAVFKNSERVESVRYFSDDDDDKVNDDEIVFTEQHTNIPCCEYDTNMQVMLQTAVEEYPGKKDTARNEILYESIIKDDPIREPGEPGNTMEQILENAGVLLNPCITLSGCTSNVSIANEQNDSGNMISETIIKTSVEDEYGNLIKENGDSFLEELRRKFLDADGRGFTLFDSGIALTKEENYREGELTLVTLRNGSQLGMTSPFSNVFLYYQLERHLCCTGQLDHVWYRARDRITQEKMLMKKVPVSSNWVKLLHNFLSLPYHRSFLDPYAVLYDRNGFLYFLMEDRNVLAVGTPPNGFCLNKWRCLCEVLNIFRYCKENSLFPSDTNDFILYTKEEMCFNPSCLRNLEDLGIFKKMIKSTFMLLLNNEPQEELSLMESELILEKAYQYLEKDIKLPAQHWLNHFIPSFMAGPFPFH